MRRLADLLYHVALTLWVGGLWVTGLVVAPVLFASLGGNRPLAGQLAGRLFEVMGWLGLACASYLLLFVLLRRGSAAWRRWTLWLLLLMLLLTLVSLFGIQPLLAQLKADALPREVMESVSAEPFRRLAWRVEHPLPRSVRTWLAARDGLCRAWRPVRSCAGERLAAVPETLSLATSSGKRLISAANPPGSCVFWSAAINGRLAARSGRLG
jgi:hypothetical protein